MRDAFIARLVELAREDDSIELLTGDLGFGVLRAFKEEFPTRFHNVGIAEQLMIEMATGMALAGKKVVCYSIGNFPVLRCLEQIRNDAAYSGANVKIVEVGGGFTYGQLGMSHNALEDLAVLLPIPDLSIFTPSDPAEAIMCADLMIKQNGASFIRLERSSEALLSEPFENLDGCEGAMCPICHLAGNDVALLSYGSIASQVLSVAQETGAAFYSVPLLKPMNIDGFKEKLCQYKRIIVVEEHSFYGGLFSLVCSVLSSVEPKLEVISFSAGAYYPSFIGTQDHLRRAVGLLKENIASVVKE